MGATGEMSIEHLIPSWFAVYTRAHHEKTSADQMSRRSVEYFLPTYESVRRWKDRHKRLSLPLFPGYVFVRVSPPERRSVLQIPGVVHFVGFGGQPAPLGDDEIEKLRRFLSQGAMAEPHPYFAVGRRVRIARGSLAGLEGVLVRKKNCLRLVISIELIRQSATIEVDAADVEPVARAARSDLPDRVPFGPSAESRLRSTRFLPGGET
jgi:transcription antitermination factor NusG